MLMLCVQPIPAVRERVHGPLELHGQQQDCKQSDERYAAHGHRVYSTTSRSDPQSLEVRGNQLTGNVPSVASPSALTAGGSGLCPNFLNHTPDPAWDTASGVTPWYTNCAAPPCPTLEIDCNGAADPLTDGLLVIRYLFGLRGAALIQGAVGDAARRAPATEIETYIQSLLQ